MDAMKGGCQCGSLRYEVTAEPIAVAICHCSECQRQSGSAFGMSMIVAADAFALTSGTLRSFTRAADSGGTVECAFCPDCGTRIFHRRSLAQDTVNVKPGTLDDPSWLRPALQVWTVRGHAWVSLPEGIPSFEKNPG